MNIIDNYLERYINYIKSLNSEFGNIRSNANKNKKIIFVNTEQNNSVKAKYMNNSNSQQLGSPRNVPVDIYTTLLIEQVYFAT